MRFLKTVLAIIIVLVVVYLVGPTPDSPNYSTELPSVTGDLNSLEKLIAAGEASHKIKPNNEARIVWANDSLKQKTKYALVYLHGFSASQEEGNPVHRSVAKTFGCNLYLSRLSEHGIDTTESLVNMTATSLWESAKTAYAIGKQLGDSVILMGTSTGGTLALQLAATYPEIAGLVLYSPNIAINDPNAWLLNNPWGLQIARLVKQSDYITTQKNIPLYNNYWNHHYRLEATIQLEELLETTMTKEYFEKITQPVLVLHYYKNELEQDRVVKVSAMKEMLATIKTPHTKKKILAIPTVGNHVIASPILSKDIESVTKQTLLFIKNIYGLDQRVIN